MAATFISGAGGLQSPSVALTGGQQEKMSRWSDLNITEPGIITNPSSEDEVRQAIRLAKEKNMSVVVGGRGHGSFVSVNSSNLYLDMKSFQSVELDKDANRVQVGGGTSTGQVLKHLAENGYYTTLPNSNAVGVVGAILGGGNSPQNGIRGYMVDNVVSFRLITSDEEVVEVDAAATGEKLALFNALCGAGHGLGVVTSVTMQAYPIAELNMPDDKLWTRLMIFPPSALPQVAKAFVSLQPPRDSFYPQLSFARGPPGSPMEGRPIIVTSVFYYGSEEMAEKAAAPLLDPELVGLALQAQSSLIGMSDVNNALEPMNVHGGLKCTYGARLKLVSEETLETIFAKWMNATEAVPDARRSALVFQTFNTSKLEVNGASEPGKAKFLESRDRGILLVVAPWCTNASSFSQMTCVAEEILALCRKGDDGPPRTIANLMGSNEPLTNLFTDAKIAELARLKYHWDSSNVFWSPYSRAG